MEERNLLLHDGISTLTVDDGGAVLIERLITTYETNAYGIDDISYLDVNTLKTLAYLRYSVRARISMRFPRHKLASDGTGVGAGQAVVTPKVIRAELIALFRDWETAGAGREHRPVQGGSDRRTGHQRSQPPQRPDPAGLDQPVPGLRGPGPVPPVRRLPHHEHEEAGQGRDQGQRHRP